MSSRDVERETAATGRQAEASDPVVARAAAEQLLALQRSLGNAAVARMLSPPREVVAPAPPASIEPSPLGLQRKVTHDLQHAAGKVLDSALPKRRPAAPRPGPRGGERILLRKVTGALMKQGQAALDKIEGKAVVIVVPNGFNLSEANPGITVKDPSKIELYQKMVEQYKDEFEAQGPELEAIKASIKIDTILVKESVVAEGGMYMDGVIWHEHGHVLHGVKENGLVFAYELTMLKNHYSRTELKDWVDRRRGGVNYFARFVQDPGIAELGTILKELGYTDWDEKRHKVVTHAPVAKKKLVMPGEHIRGTLTQLREQLGYPADAKLPPTADVGKDFAWRQGTKWRLHSADSSSGETIYDLERIS